MRLCRASPLPRPSTRHPRVLKATPDGPHRCTKRGRGGPCVSRRDAPAGMQAMAPATPASIVGASRGGGGPWQHHPGPPNPIAGCFISVVIWGHFSQEPGAVEMKAGCRRQRLGGRGEMQGLRGWLRPRSPAERLSKPPPRHPPQAWPAEGLCRGPCCRLQGESTPGVHRGGPWVLQARPQGRWGLEGKGWGPGQAELPPPPSLQGI